MRTITLGEYNQETGSAGAAPAVAQEEEESQAELTPADEISPELLYTAEHEVPAVRAALVVEGQPPASDRDANSKRRRGRRGGRRGRGGNGAPPGPSNGGRE